MSLSSSLLILILCIFAGVGIFFLVKKNTKTTKSSSCVDLHFLINEIKIYIKNTYPNIQIDYQKIESMKNKTQLLAEDILIIEDIVMQFATQNIQMHPKFYVSKDQLWSGYDEMSVPLKGKMPKDFLKRKELAYKKYNGTCARCGQKLKISDAMTYLFRSLENGGSYHFENMAVVCYDCNKVLTTQEDMSKVMHSLQIYDYLIHKINH